MLSSKNRFYGRRQPRIVMKHGRSARSGPLMMRALQNPKHQGFKAAVMITKKVSPKAVMRNRMRRKIYEAIRLTPPALPGSELVVSVFDKNVEKMPQNTLTNHLNELYQKLNLKS